MISAARFLVKKPKKMCSLFPWQHGISYLLVSLSDKEIKQMGNHKLNTRPQRQFFFIDRNQIIYHTHLMDVERHQKLLQTHPTIFDAG
jgi:hypothetical protein